VLKKLTDAMELARNPIVFSTYQWNAVLLCAQEKKTPRLKQLLCSFLNYVISSYGWSLGHSKLHDQNRSSSCSYTHEIACWPLFVFFHIIPSINTCCWHPALLIRTEGRNVTETYHFYPFSEVTDQNFPDDGVQSSNDPCKKQKSTSGTASNDQGT